MNLCGNRIKPILRNCIVGKWIPNTQAVDNALGLRIIDRAFHDSAAKRVFPKLASRQRLAEIAFAIRKSGNYVRPIGDSVGLAKPFQTYEEESLIVAIIYIGNPDRPAQGKAKVISAHAALRVNKRSARVQGLISKILICGSMECISTGPHGHIENATSSLSKFGGVVAGLNRDLLDRIHANLIIRPQGLEHSHCCVLTFDPDSLCVRRGAINTQITC